MDNMTDGSARANFMVTYRDMLDRLGKTLEIADYFLGARWSWTGDFEIEGDMVEATMSAYFCGEEDIEHVSFPLEWLWTDGPDGDLRVTFHKGHKYQEALYRNKKAASDARKKDEQDKRDRRELERLAEKFSVEVTDPRLEDSR